MSKKCGIYVIRNIKNNKVYVGRTTNFEKREARHRLDLKKGIDSAHLQRSWNKHGAECFVWEVLEECNYLSQIEREAFWIKKLNSGDSKFGYNLRIEGGEEGITYFREESKEKCSKWQKGRILTEEHKKSISEGLSSYYLKNKVRKETRKKLSKASKGREHSDKSKEKISEGLKKMYSENPDAKRAAGERASQRWENLSSEEKNKKMKALQENNRGRKHSEETKRKKSEAMKRYWERKKLERNLK